MQITGRNFKKDWFVLFSIRLG